jgi:tetratricopeptide (TPR) repeat protein
MTEINLEPLNENETALLVNNASGGEVSRDDSARLFKETKGNPLFTLEMIRSGLPEQEHGKNEQNPQTVQNAVEARLAQLSAPARELTGLAATVGRAFTFDVLAHASDISEDELMRGLDELWQRKIVREQAANAYDFSHSKLGEVAYAGLDTARQQLLHRKVAEALEATAETDLDLVSGEIASHFEQAGLLDRAIPYYIRAGDSAREVYANQAAIEYYQRVLSLLPQDAKVDVMLKLGQVWLLVGNWTEAEALFWQALRLSQDEDDLHTQARCEASLGETLHLKGSYVEALTWLEHAREAFGQLDDQKGVCDVLGSIGKIYFWQLDNTSALKSFEQQLQIASQIADQQAVGSSSGNMGLVYWQMGENDRALNYFKQQLQVSKETSDLSGTSRAIGRIGLVYWALGDYTRALEFFEEQLQIANEIGDRLGVGFAVGNIGNVFFKQGKFSRAMEYYTQQLRIAKGLGERREISHALRNMGMLFAEQGAFEKALSYHAQSLQIAIEIETARAIGRAVGDIAIVYAMQEDFDRAEELFQQIKNLIPESAFPYYLCEYLYHYAAMLARQERFEDAFSVNKQAANIASRIKRKDIQFKTELLEIRLEASLHQIKPAIAANRCLSLLPRWPAEDQQVLIYDALFTLGAGNKDEIETYRQMAVELYRTLHDQTTKFEYRRRYEEITGERLSEPDTIAELPESLHENALDLDALLKQVELMSGELLHKVRV